MLGQMSPQTAHIHVSLSIQLVELYKIIILIITQLAQIRKEDFLEIS